MQAKTPSASLDAGRSFAETIQVMISVKLINSVSQAKTPSASLNAGRSFAETIQVMISVKLINSVSFKKTGAQAPVCKRRVFVYGFASISSASFSIALKI